MPKREPRKMGRKGVTIHWDEVNLLLEAGCLGTEIAESLGILPQTFYERCERDLGCSFTDLLQEKRKKGENLLKVQQYMKALGKTNKGDNMMLVWLGKNRLNQSDSPQELELKAELVEKHDKIINQLSALQSDWLKHESSKEDSQSHNE